MGDTVIRGESVEESARFVLSMGVTRPTLVDEIFCQIIKQTTSNKSKHPYAMGFCVFRVILCEFT